MADKTSDESDEQNDVETLANMAGAAGQAAGAIVDTVGAAALGADPVVTAGAGAVVQSIASDAVRRAATLVLHRALPASRESARVDRVTGEATRQMARNEMARLPIRSDGFFDSTIDDRSPAEEVAEAVLEAARLEHEERKVVYFGRLLGNIACRPDINRAEANALIRTSRGLSYRQLVLLAMFVQGRPIRYQRRVSMTARRHRWPLRSKKVCWRTNSLPLIRLDWCNSRPYTSGERESHLQRRRYRLLAARSATS